MRSIALLVLLSLLVAAPARAAHSGPIDAPTDGFGAPGPYAVATLSFPSPRFAGQEVTVYRPDGVAGPRPTWFFCHGFGGYRVTFYDPILRHLASHGWTAVFSPYAVSGTIEEHYDELFSGFAEAAARYPEFIDTRKVGFAGHSFGGGAAPALLLRAFRELGWGQDARCLMPMAPWYSFQLSDQDLADYPAGTQLVMQVYEDDVVNDHRMAIDVFRRLAVPASDKDFLLLRSDEIDGYAYQSGHNVPARGADDAVFERGVLRIIAALSASTFSGDPAGRSIALAGGAPAQRDMGSDASGRALRPMMVSDDPLPRFAEQRFAYPFSHVGNPRRASPPPEPSEAPAHLVNLSVRARSEGGDRVLVAGAVLAGSEPKSLLIRGVGPGLARFGVAERMADPRIAVYRGPAFDLGGDDWADAPNLDIVRAAGRECGAFVLAEGSADAALCRSFDPGVLTVHASAATGAPGVVLAELYDADLGASSRLVNLSGRAHVGSGDTLLIAGFVIRGGGTARLLVRAVGPTLAALGVSEVLPDPRLALYADDGSLIADNDDWQVAGDPAQLASAMAVAGAFALPDGSRDAAVFVTLPAGVYTAHAADAAGRSGNLLVEVYVLP